MILIITVATCMQGKAVQMVNSFGNVLQENLYMYMHVCNYAQM